MDMKKATSWALLILLFVPLFWACDDDEGCYPPTYKGFSYTPSPALAGDSLTITAVQAKKGHYLNACTYNFSMTVRLDQEDGSYVDTLLSQSISTNYDGKDNSDPTWTLVLPSNTRAGSYSCSFSAQWSNSADGDGGTFACQNDGSYSGSINAYSYTLYSNASGSCSITVK